ncbi:zinc finger and BTB domain-containing protein 24-like [Wyeomyia smithii]|uniref:zinc finger and BTB domain-containing protein 24-like n=1 Tax=Wyeomyia smithii TaxID=174621 RepID=UPI0024680D7E|nr:zinc finger and BTB domain-containing protein 24-like [Wyeomyia smithii]XP_055534315.1 zinc finger and BTB domain-containing protein 24-like [Wyeomyia smithii]
MQKKTARRDCFIPGCASQMGQVVFMSAYKSDGLQRWWSETIWAQKRKNKQIPKNSRVCEKHFEEKYIDRSYKMPRLFPDAWPTMNIATVFSEELVCSERQSDDQKTDVKQEVNPRVYCRFCGRKENRPIENQLHQLPNGKEFLKFCLGQYYQKEYFPQGICENCMETVQFLLNFVRQCNETQHRFDQIFEPQELKLELNCDITENILLKQEKDEESEYINETDNSKEMRFKPEKAFIQDASDDETFIASDQESSDSFRSDEEFRPDVNNKLTIANAKALKSRIRVESDSECDSDTKPLIKRKYRKKTESKRTTEFKDNLIVVDDFPDSEQDSYVTKKIRQPKPKRERSSAGPGETSRICPICGKILVHKGNFTSHLKIHSDKKDYVCNICGKQYYIRRELQMHIESLHEKKTFVCNICGIKCAWRKGLQRHMKNKHSDESSLKHKCTYCGKAFLLPNQLRLHIMKHTGDRITCDLCGAGYRFNYMLTQHKIREHGMEFKGVKLYKTSSRSRKTVEAKPPANTVSSTAIANVDDTQPSSASVSHLTDSNHGPIASVGPSQSHHIPQSQQAQHEENIQQYHTTTQLERVHYQPSFVYSTGSAPVMMLPSSGVYNG